ncbi:very-long-chain 3-oxoacyl-CoA reductase-like [Gigantopelta aegis]|uniref:very-long-chain 3-oxoacyl-CoA reductase-like n=1 Tax=Gigantopelta aegis TaxID=1735272 RepID=UPI001B88CC8F|nr:very-long-chain 3-oxoacyl-CoA reductase-like [Gigantopelta aegis]
MAATLADLYNDNSSKLAAFGLVASAYVLCKFMWTVGRGIATYFVGPALGLSADLKKAGAWAVVTGCTDGIGKAYAFQIAKKGVNVVLISRTQSKLDELAKEIETKYQVQTCTIAADFTDCSKIYDKIRDAIKGLEIGTLVNNVGMALPYPEYFVELPDRDQILQNMIHVNMSSVTMMTSLILPDMVQRRRGYVINIASGAAEQPLPLFNIYSATKIYVDYLSKSLHEEVHGKGVTVQVVRPNFVATKLSGIRKTNLITPSPNTFVSSALATLGLSTSTNGYWIHAVQSYVVSWVVSMKAAHFLFLRIRKAALKRIARKNKGN